MRTVHQTTAYSLTTATVATCVLVMPKHLLMLLAPTHNLAATLAAAFIL